MKKKKTKKTNETKTTPPQPLKTTGIAIGKDETPHINLLKIEGVGQANLHDLSIIGQGKDSLTIQPNYRSKLHLPDGTVIESNGETKLYIVTT